MILTEDIKRLLKPIWRSIQSLARTATVAKTDFSGTVPIVQGETDTGGVRDINYPGHFGFLARPNGSTRIVYVKLGDNPDQLVAVASIDPESVPVELAEGEAIAFSDSGAYTHYKADGAIDVMPAGSGTINLAGTSDKLALASKVEAELNKVVSALTAVAAGGGVYTGVNTYTAVVPVGSSKVKAI